MQSKYSEQQIYLNGCVIFEVINYKFHVCTLWCRYIRAIKECAQYEYQFLGQKMDIKNIATFILVV